MESVRYNLGVLQVVILSLSSKNISLPFSRWWKVIWMKFQFNYPRRKFHCLCPGKRQKAPTPEPQWGAGWHRRLRNCLPNGDLSLPANYIVVCRDERMVQRDSSRTPHFPSSCKTLPTRATFIFLEKPGVPLKGLLCFVPLLCLTCDVAPLQILEPNGKFAQLPFGKSRG